MSERLKRFIREMHRRRLRQELGIYVVETSLGS